MTWWFEELVLAHAAGYKKEKPMPGKTDHISKLTGIVKNATAAMNRAKIASEALNSGAGVLVDKIAQVESITAEVNAASAQLDEAIVAMTSDEESPLSDTGSSTSGTHLLSATGPVVEPRQPQPSLGQNIGNVPGTESGAAKAFAPGVGAAPLIINTGNAEHDLKASISHVHDKNK